MAGEKMSKSLGNSLLVDAMVTRPPGRPALLPRAPHYRSVIEYTEEALAEAGAAYGRIEGFVPGRSSSAAAGAGAEVPAAFAAAMDDDLAVPQALAVVHDTVRAGNTRWPPATSWRSRPRWPRSGRCSACSVSTRWTSPGPGEPRRRPAGRRRHAGDRRPGQRQAARERRDYAAADAIRDELQAAGVVIEDTPHGPRWELTR